MLAGVDELAGGGVLKGAGAAAETVESSEATEALNPIHGVWWQWWLRDVPNPPPIRLPLKVGPGHEIMASLFVADTRHVTFLIANHSTGEVCTPFKVLEPSAVLTPDRPVEPLLVSGATGEWITERPVNWTTGLPDTLPFFQKVEFRHCLVVLGRAPA